MSFQKGQRKVGTASELPLARRAQLAVVAHVRHLYTDYDRLLKQGSFHEARSSVEQPTLAKVVAWRGDDENGQTVLEDVFREVIVISDDEDSDLENETANTTVNAELLSSNRAETYEVQTQPIRAESVSIHDPSLELLEEAPPGFRVITQVPAKTTMDRRGFSRYQAWNRALTRYRAEAQRTEQPQPGEASTERQSPRYTQRPAVVQESLEITRRREPPAQPVESSSRVVSGSVYTEIPPQRPLQAKNYVGSTERRVRLETQRSNPHFETNGWPHALTTQKPFEAHKLETSPRWAIRSTYPQGKIPLHMDSTRSDRLPTSPNDRTNAPVFVSGPKELQISHDVQLGSKPEFPVRPQMRSDVYSQDHVLPSIEAPWPSEKRRTDARLEQMTKRMSLRSVTPVHHLGDNHGSGSGPGSPDDQNSKRRRLAYHNAPQLGNHSDSRDTRPIGISTSDEQGPRVQYRGDELGPEHRSQDMQYRPRDHLNLTEKPPLGPQRERPSGTFAPQANPTGRWEMERTRTVDPPLGHIPRHNFQPSSGPGGTILNGDRSPRTTLDASRPGIRSYYGDRSPRMDHVPHSMAEQTRLPTWNPRTDGHRALIYDAPPGKQYADGFVRSVDIREARPAEYYVENPRHQPSRTSGNIIQPSRARIPDQLIVMDVLQPRAVSEQRQLPNSRVAPPSHHQTSHFTETTLGGRQFHRRVPTTRERRPGSGLSNTRRTHDPRAFQMAEQNRPIYVQRVESQPPQHNMSDERPVILVD
ncbi:hypothetical protein N7478_007306 [Penicillium angulare]|uniref:uncharacterized protein n=1 Tax=Penicillium angulare TaxID=116970 RepID=UPI002541687A|nr:uncharacterized protein N7478_007306 [Penicillium angulare]KAJ5281934.1 hypothetical protein N7478_007306 [Penicillium angulare]